MSMTTRLKLARNTILSLRWVLILPYCIGSLSSWAQTSTESNITPTTLPCQQDFSFNQAALGSFDANKETFYHFAQFSKAKSQTNAVIPYFKYKLISINLHELKLKTIMDMDLPQLTGMIIFGNPIQGFITTTLEDESSECFFGKGYYAALKLSLQAKQIQIYKDSGSLIIVKEKIGNSLFDFQKKEVIELDFSKSQQNDLQTRTQKFLFPDGEIPVYMDLRKKHFYTWHFLDEYTQRGLVAYDGRGNAVGRLQFARGDKLLQNKNLFGVLSTNKAENKLIIRELAKWTDVSASKNYEITLPANLSVAEASVQVNFPKGYAVISGMKELEQKKWGKILLYDYHTNRELTQFSAPQGVFTKHIYLSDNGLLMICENASSATQDFHSYSIYHTKEKTWKTLTL